MFYSDAGHFKNTTGYEIDGLWYPRVTAINSIKAKPGLYKFYAEQENFKAGEAIKAKSAEEGTLLHDTIEAILKGEKINISKNIQPAVDAFLDFAGKNQIIPHKIEERILSKRHRYAGTIDVLAELNGILGILDIKTSYAIYRDYNIQISAYKEALEEFGSPPLARWILRVDQAQACSKCGAKRRVKGGNEKIRGGEYLCNHSWGLVTGETELKELVDHKKDFEAFLAAKRLWEWEHEYWLKFIGYL